MRARSGSAARSCGLDWTPHIARTEIGNGCLHQEHRASYDSPNDYGHDDRNDKWPRCRTITEIEVFV